MKRVILLFLILFFQQFTNPTCQPTGQPSSQPSLQPTNRPSRQPSRQPSSQPSSQPSRQPTGQPSMQPSRQPSGQPSRQPTGQPTGEPTRQPSGQPSRQPSMQPSGQPSRQPTGQPTGEPTSQPSGQPSRQPSRQPTGQPSRQPTGQPSRQPSRQPTGQPSRQPTSQPTGEPTRQPSGQPSRQPTGQPTGEPTRQPSGQPSRQPSRQPTGQPSRQPTGQPTGEPTSQPSGRPSRQPSMQPTTQPSRQPTMQPSSQPSSYPSMQPSAQPSMLPSAQPSSQPTTRPSSQPSRQPSRQPSSQPSRHPTGQPTTQPSGQPSAEPSVQPTSQPTGQPTRQPTSQPSHQPSRQPTGQPTRQPTNPTGQPTRQPTRQPSCQPSAHPSRQPTSKPSSRPSVSPTATTMTKISIDFSQAFKNLPENKMSDGSLSEADYKGSVERAVAAVFKQAYPAFVISDDSQSTKMNTLYVKWKEVTRGSRRLDSSNPSNLDPSVPHSYYGLRGASLTNTSYQANQAQRRLPIVSTCNEGICYVTYKVRFTAEVVNKVSIALAASTMASTLNTYISDFTMESKLRENANFQNVEAQYTVSIVKIYEANYLRSRSPTPAPTFTSAPTIELIVATRGTGLYIMVSFFGFFVIAVTAAGFYWLKKTMDRKSKERERIKKMDKWNKDPRKHPSHDKDPDFLGIYGSYIPSCVPSSEPQGEDDDWIKKVNKDNGRTFWLNKNTEKVTYKRPITRLKSKPDLHTNQDDTFETDDGTGNRNPKSSDKKKSGKDLPQLKRGLSTPVRVKASLEHHSDYNNINASSDFFAPPFPTRNKIRDTALIPDINLWFEKSSKRHGGKTYWKHQVTNEISWRPPAELDYYQKQPSSPGLKSASFSRAQSASPWTPKESRKYGLTYWKHDHTGEITWENPHAGQDHGVSNESVYIPPSLAKSGSSRSPSHQQVEEDHPPSTKELWMEKYSTEHGLPYYKRTDGAISWEMPLGDHVEIRDYKEVKATKKTPLKKTKTNLDLS